MAINNNYEICLIENEADARLCAKLISEEFALHNPLAVFYKITAEEFFDKRIWPLMMDVMDEKLSFFVRHRPTNEIVAAIVGSDLLLLCEKHPYDASDPTPTSPVSDLYDEMRDEFVHHDFNEKLKLNMILRLSTGVTKFEHSGKGLAAQLRTHVCDYARNTKGFQYVFIQTSNPATRHIYINKMNAKELTIIHPENWIWKKKGDGLLSRPLKDYRGEPIVNILVELK
jgi:hypothetical protein